MKRRLFVALMVAGALIIGMIGAGTAAGYKYDAKKETARGCTPGYWKNHTESWDTYSPNQKFSAVFDNAFGDMTLLAVLQQGGGGLKALGRHTVAALLNGASTEVPFYWSDSEVISAFNATYPDGNFDYLKWLFERENEKGCPLN